MTEQRAIMADVNKVTPGGSGGVVVLGDGSRWSIAAGDKDASPLVSHLRRAMQLDHADEASHRLLVFAEDSVYHAIEECRADDLAESSRWDGQLSPREKVVRDSGGRYALACLIPDRLSLDRRLMRATRLVCLHSQAKGGLLIHGALAERDGCGVILAGPWGVGKSTASGRLLPPWRSLCDDLTLVVRDGKGQYRAHPWPTWSRFANGGPGGNWEVNRAVPLTGVFFLQQAQDNHARPVDSEEAIGLLAEAAKQAEWRLFERRLVRQSGRLERFHNICELVKYVPSFILQISLSGAFWEEMEKALVKSVVTTTTRFVIGTSDDTRYCGCIGASMTPTLSREDIVEVEPCVQARAGDVLLFKSGGKLVIHRVVAVKPEGLMTRGDHNNRVDASWLAPQDIVGRVVAAYRGSRRRQIHGGRGGQRFALQIRILRSLYRVLYRTLAPGYHRAFRWGITRWLAPIWKPMVVSFKQEELRLLSGKKVVGWYHPSHGWKIKPFFRLFVDETKLPGQPAGETSRHPPKSASCSGLSSQ